VVLLSNGGAVELPDSYLNAQAIMEGYLLGQSGASAIVDLVFGAFSPSGKLPETMPLRMSDPPADFYFPGTRDYVEHREGLDVGYRYYDTADAPVRFPFGHGLSYTTFEYGDLQTEVVQDAKDSKKVEVSFTVKNTGSMVGREVAQCYIHDVDSTVYRPKHELKDFVKVKLKPGESKQIIFHLHYDAFSFYDIGIGGWVVEPGAFEIQIGSSSRDIRLRGTIDFAVGVRASKVARTSYPPLEQRGTLKEVDDETFAKRFGKNSAKELEAIRERKKGVQIMPFDRNSLLKEVGQFRYIGRLFLYIVYKEASKEVKPGPSERRQKLMIRTNVENLPLRFLVLFSKGGLSFETLDTLISTMNYRVFGAMSNAGKACAGFLTDNCEAMLGKRR